MLLGADDQDQDIDVANDSVAQQNIRLLQVKSGDEFTYIVLSCS